MAYLMLHNVCLNANNEHELIPVHGHEFTVEVTDLEGKMTTYQQVSEVHWKFESEFEGESQVAIESDIRQTGQTIRLDRIAGMSIMVSPSKA